MTATTTPISSSPTVWVRAALPKHLHAAILKQQAQATVDTGKRQPIEEVIIATIAKGLDMPVDEG